MENMLKPAMLCFKLTPIQYMFYFKKSMITGLHYSIVIFFFFIL